MNGLPSTSPATLMGRPRAWSGWGGAPGTSWAVLAALVVVLLGSGQAGAQQGSDAACLACHGEPELLRQRAGSRAEALALHVDGRILAASAHGGTTCGECHTGVQGYPHPNPVTETCASCHQSADDPWRSGVHAEITDEGHPGAECVDCHGVHDVAFTSDTLGVPDIPRMNTECASCHVENVLPPGDPHAADTVGCYGCHAPHATRTVDDPLSRLAPENQAEQACERCHTEEVELVRTDVHYAALHGVSARAGRPARELHGDAEEHEPPACVDCHGGHELAGPETALATIDEAAVCGECHEEQVESFADSYHGQATALGSTVAATCSDCHTGHTVLPKDNEASSVHPAALLETCAGECHDNVTASFTAFQPHANHHDRETYPYAWWSYRLMTGLLVCTFGVFGLHTAMWLGRLAVDGLRAAPREEGS